MPGCPFLQPKKKTTSMLQTRKQDFWPNLYLQEWICRYRSPEENIYTLNAKNPARYAEDSNPKIEFPTSFVIRELYGYTDLPSSSPSLLLVTALPHPSLTPLTLSLRARSALAKQHDVAATHREQPSPAIASMARANARRA